MVQRFRLFSYLQAAILIGSGLVFGAILFYDFSFCRRILDRAQAEKYTTLLQTSAEEMTLQLRHVEAAVYQNFYFYTLSSQLPGTEEIVRQIEIALRASPDIFGMEIILSKEGQQRRGDDFRVAYGWREDDRIELTLDRDVEEDYQTDWYRRPTEEIKGAVWSEPYFDPVPQTYMMTYSLPLIDEDGTVLGVFTADISLQWLERSLVSLPLGHYGEPVLLSEKGMFVDCSREEWRMKESLGSLADSHTGADRQIFLDLMDEMKKPQGVFKFRRVASGEMAHLYHRLIGRTGWNIGCVIPEREVMETTINMVRGETCIALVGILLMILFAWLIARSVARPIRSLSSAAGMLAEGSFDAPLPSTEGRSEISQLSKAFDKMRTDLKEHIRQKEEAARVQARIGAELRLAHSIQLNMVSREFEPPREFGVDVCAVMEPALDVGGDLYDFEMLDDKNFYFCIGDVSGKGVPASLFMAMGKTLLKSTMKALRDPAKVLEQVNTELMRGNKEGLFITALCGILNVKTGEVIYANAGHTPPIALKAGGKCRFVDILPSFPLAMMEGTEYENQTARQETGEIYILYSDGATDAENLGGENFGSERLLSAAGNAYSSCTAQTIESITGAIHAFAKGTEKQADDITLLAISLRSGVPPKDAC
ncbi:MAG: SpoIIE family protein phosphatase [Thermoguttaceae bacterium]|nr:SpoIIE family protein phosphatase [Thermoguttaceae bacterium]